MKISKYNLYIDKEYIFNLKSQSILKLDTKIIDDLQRGDMQRLDSNSISILKKFQIVEDYIVEDYDDFFDKTINELNSSNAYFLSLTSHCNFECGYCYESSRKLLHSKEHLSIERWDKIKEYIINIALSKQSKNVAIVLYGGEPLLNKEVLKRIVEDKSFFNNHHIEVEYSLISNGSLLKSIPDKSFWESIDLCQITLDGYEKAHNNVRYYSNGKPSFHDIYQNLFFFSQKFPNKFTIRLNVATVDLGFYTLIDQLSNDNMHKFVKCLSISPVFEDQICGNEKIDYILGNEKIVRFIEELKHYATKKGFDVSNTFGRGPCLYLSNYPGCIDEKMNLYHCPGLLYHDSYGNLVEDVNTKTEDNKKIKNCYKTCKYGPICFGGCYWREGSKVGGCSNFKYFEKYLITHIRNHIERKKEKEKIIND